MQLPLIKISSLLVLATTWLGCPDAARQTPASAMPPAAAAPAIQMLPPVPPKLVTFDHKMNGLTMVAPPRPFTNDPMAPVKAIHANWIAVVPYAFTRPGTATVRYHTSGGQWWGESTEGAAATIRRAHEAGLKVMLKPQVFIPRGWTGTMDYATPEEWASWEAGYTEYIMAFARVADSTQADLFCIGTEFHNAIMKRTDYWRNLIRQVRSVCHCPLVYSSNWDDWDKVPFWDELDFIGLGGYFPLIESKTPSVDSLKIAWKPIHDRLAAFSKEKKRQVIFTEYGYLTVDHCGWRNWELEQGIRERSINQQAQANCFDALHATFQDESWWAGGFLWKWFPNGQGHEGYPERDYTPQGKQGEQVLKKWFGRSDE